MANKKKAAKADKGAVPAPASKGSSSINKKKADSTKSSTSADSGDTTPAGTEKDAAKKAGKKAIPKAAPVKDNKKTTPPPEKKTTAPNDGISGFVRQMMMPKEEGSKVCGCTFGEANKAVQKKFGRQLYASEFGRNFDKLKKEGVLETKQALAYKKKEKVVDETAAAPETPAAETAPVTDVTTDTGSAEGVPE